jgi:bacterioferritin
MELSKIEKINSLLNDLLKSEFTTINQYWLYGLTLSHQSLGKLSKIFLKESIEERSHVEKISQRILQLNGSPVFNITESVPATKNVKDMLEIGLKLENIIITKYQEAIAQLEDMHDYATVEILSGILKEEEGHKAWLNSQLLLLEKLGEQIYLSLLTELE